MLASNAYVIRSATPEELRALGPSFGSEAHPALVGEIEGRPAAALLADGRMVSDPFRATSLLRSFLRMRARALCAHARTPKLSARLRAAVPVVTASALPA
jgi:hypothetical protein